MPVSADRTHDRLIPKKRRELTDVEVRIGRALITTVIAAQLLVPALDYFRHDTTPPPTTPKPELKEKISAGARAIYAGTLTEDFFKRSFNSRFDAVHCGKYGTPSGPDIYIGFPVIPDLKGNLLHEDPGLQSRVVGTINQGEKVAAQIAIYVQTPGANGTDEEETWIDVSTSTKRAFLMAQDGQGNVNAGTPGLPECRAASKMGSF